MKKKTAVTLIAAMLLTNAGFAMEPFMQRASAATASMLAIGAYGSSVTDLQSDLKTLGYFTYPTLTGYFGSVTRDAVYAFQKDYGLYADGIAGPLTLEAISHAKLKQLLLQDAKTYIGTPYAWGGSSPATGFDCSGFVYFMFTKFGIPSQRTTSNNLYTMGYSVNKSMLRPGDLVFFKIGTSGLIDHVGFYLGGGEFISATSSKGIYVQNLGNTYWGPRYSGARRLY